MDGFNFFRSYYEASKHLTDIEQGMFYKAIMEYMFDDTEPELDGALMGFWILLKPTLDISKKRSKSSKTKTKQNQNKTISNQKQNDIKTTSNQKQNDIKIDSSPPKEKEKEKEKEKDKGVSTRAKQFSFSLSKQTQLSSTSKLYQQKLKEYIQQSKFSMTYEEFYEKCEMKGYKYKNFKLAYGSWNKKDANRSPTGYRNFNEPEEGSIGWLEQQRQKEVDAIDVEVE